MMSGDTNPNSAEPVTITPDPAGGVTVDPQNPLPEPSFAWRRILAYITVIAVLAISWQSAGQMHDLKDSNNLLELSKWLIGFAALLATYYYVAPSASELTNMIQNAKIIKTGIITAAKNAPGLAPEQRQADSAPSGTRTPPEPEKPLEDDSEDYAPRGPRP